METIDCAVIGAGVVGLAIARAIAQTGREVLILEACDNFGTGISSRNSQVIHAGIYYPTGTLKAQLCVAGRKLLYEYCRTRAIGHQRLGKLIVATRNEELPALEGICQRARANGVDDIETLTADAARAMEPEVACVAALYSPSTGIIDGHALMLSLLGEAQDAGAVLALQSPVQDGEVTNAGIMLEVGGAEPIRIMARSVINCAGLGAQACALSIRGLPSTSVPPLHYAKGNYYTLAGRAPFAHLVYPVPRPGGLGIHLTLDLGGAARFGPDVEWVSKIDYHVGRGRVDDFCAAIRSYWPGLPDNALVPAYAGIRPKPHAPGEPDCDFIVQGAREHGVAGLVCLYGIESPGLTASLALADYVVSGNWAERCEAMHANM